jgi:hypothetical protein
LRASCTNRCNAAEDETIRNCKEGYREDKKECREDKREDKRECRDAKRVEKEICKQNKIDEKVACNELSGNAKRECRKQARQNKRECKKQARQTKKACKREGREDKSACKVDAKDRRESCITEAENLSRDCRSQCANTYEAACAEEHQAAEVCAAEALPVFGAESICKEVCDDEKDEALAGYNSSCRPGGHAGDKGATITFYNASNEVRHYYRPEPYPETQPTGPLSLFMEYVASLDQEESYVQELACGMSLSFHFKRQRTEGSNFVGQQFNLGPYPCCENAVEQTLVINPNGS